MRELLSVVVVVVVVVVVFAVVVVDLDMKTGSDERTA